MSRYARLALVGGATLLGTAATAETVTNYQELVPGTPIATYLGPENNLSAMYQAANDLDRLLDRECAAEQYGRLNWTGAFIEQPITLEDGAAHPSEGIWVHRYTITRCDRTLAYQAALTARPGAGPIVDHLAPGETYTGPITQKSMLPVLGFEIGARNALPEGCRQMLVTDTRISEQPRSVDRNTELGDSFDNYARINARNAVSDEAISALSSKVTKFDYWSEVWSLKLCDATIDIPVGFFFNPYTPGISFFSREP